MKYLTKHLTEAAYEAAASNLAKPHVALTADDNKVHYMPNTPSPTPTHDYVEIGGIKWATMNIGANSITDYGLYFQWGDTQGYTASQAEGLSWNDYKFNPSGDGETFTKYNETDGKTVLDASDDVVTATWGGNWRMPTSGELRSLLDAVDVEGTYDYQGSGVSGFICTDKTDSSKVLFFPISNMEGYEQYGYYWSSTLEDNGYFLCDGIYLWLDQYDEPIMQGSNRYVGYYVRGILDE